MCTKMIVIDLDGTLIRSDKTISERTIQTLRRCQDEGIVVAIATARFWIGAEKYINLIKPDYEITTDGTMIHHVGARVYDYSFDVQTSNKLIYLIQEVNSDSEIITAIGKKVLWNSLHISESEKLHKAIFYDYKEPISEIANKIVSELPNKDIATNIAQKCNCRLISYRDENLYGFIPLEAGKIQAIESLANNLQISMDEIIAFGDDENDIDMLKKCGLGVAVANAINEVKMVADKQTFSNDEDGVAVFIEREILKEHYQ